MSKDLPYDLEELNGYVDSIKYKRGTTYKQLAIYFGVSISHLYRVRKGKRVSQPLFNRIEQTYEQVFEKYYVAVLVKIKNQPYYFVKIHVLRTFKGASNKLLGYELFGGVKDSILDTNAMIVKMKLRQWLSNYEIVNAEEVENWIVRLTRYEVEEE